MLFAHSASSVVNAVLHYRYECTEVLVSQDRTLFLSGHVVFCGILDPLCDVMRVGVS